MGLRQRLLYLQAESVSVRSQIIAMALHEPVPDSVTQIEPKLQVFDQLRDAMRIAPKSGSEGLNCDGADNDCNGQADADAAGEADVDADGSLSCIDCDDNSAANFPGNSELCDGADND